MQIDGVNSQCTGVHPLGKLHPKDQEVAEPPDQPLTEQESTVQQTTESSDSDGVLRLLQQGHFNGVSDIRLRINFHNELAAIEAQQLQAVAEEKVDGILDSVNTIIGTLTPAGGSPTELPPVDADGDGFPDSVETNAASLGGDIVPAEEQPDDLATFTQTVNQLKDDFMTAEAPSTNALVEGIQSAFDQFVESLGVALAPPDVGIEQTPDVELGIDAGEVIEPPAPLESEPQTLSIIDELTAVFESAMNQLIDAFGEVKVLTPASEPNGNGGAYNKFLNIYNDMRDL